MKIGHNANILQLNWRQLSSDEAQSIEVVQFVDEREKKKKIVIFKME